MNLKDEIDKFNDSTRPKKKKKEEEVKRLTYENINEILQGRKGLLNGFESKIFPIQKSMVQDVKVTSHPLNLATHFRILTPKKYFKDYQ